MQSRNRKRETKLTRLASLECPHENTSLDWELPFQGDLSYSIFTHWEGLRWLDVCKLQIDSESCLINQPKPWQVLAEEFQIGWRTGLTLCSVPSSFLPSLLLSVLTALLIWALAEHKGEWGFPNCHSFPSETVFQESLSFSLSRHLHYHASFFFEVTFIEASFIHSKFTLFRCCSSMNCDKLYIQSGSPHHNSDTE